MGTGFRVDKIFIDGKEFNGLSNANLEFNKEELCETLRNTPIVTLPKTQEATFTASVKIPLKWKIKFKWFEFKRKRKSKQLARLLRKCNFRIVDAKGNEIKFE